MPSSVRNVTLMAAEERRASIECVGGGGGTTPSVSSRERHKRATTAGERAIPRRGGGSNAPTPAPEQAAADELPKVTNTVPTLAMEPRVGRPRPNHTSAHKQPYSNPAAPGNPRISPGRRADRMPPLGSLRRHTPVNGFQGGLHLVRCSIEVYGRGQLRSERQPERPWATQPTTRTAYPQADRTHTFS